MGASIDDQGAVPDVEILYNVPLPSGKEYRFVLKRGKKDAGLKFHNEDRYTPEDQRVIRGIQQTLGSKRAIVDIVTSTHVTPEAVEADKERVQFSNGTEEEKQKELAVLEKLLTVMDDPGRITERPVFEAYERIRNARMAKRFEDVPVRINSRNEKSAVSESATRDNTEAGIRRYQQFLQENPTIAAVKSSYVLTPERIPLAVDKSWAMVARIAALERARAEDPLEADRRQARVDNGYTGLPEGVALDLEHIQMDAIYAVNKDGFDQESVGKAVPKNTIALFFRSSPADSEKYIFRYKTFKECKHAMEMPENEHMKLTFEKMSGSQRALFQKMYREAEFVRDYEWPERFTTVESIPEYLKNQDRRYLEIQIFDPTTGKTTRQIDAKPEQIAVTEIQLLRANLERAKQYIAGTKREGQRKKSIQRLEAELTSIRETNEAEVSGLKVEAQKRSAEIGKKIAERKKAKADPAEIAALEKERLQVFDELREISRASQDEVNKRYLEIEKLYHQIIPDEEWATFASRISGQVDQNIIKFIYVVRPDGEVIVQEEIIRGDVVSGRAAHSELAQGQNVYGAGELAFTKTAEGWVLTELNNGSGHYRPDALSTLPYVRSRLIAKGIDVSKTELVDSILRGMPLKDASAF